MSDLGPNRIEQNQIISQVSGHIFIFDKNNEKYMCGWMDLIDNLHDFKKFIKSEMEYTLKTSIDNIDEYDIFFIYDIKNNSVKRIDNQTIYSNILSEDQIFLIIIHQSNDIGDIIIQPEIYQWISENYH